MKAAAAAVLLAIMALASHASGDPTDGAYGRLNGDLGLHLGVGTALAAGEPAAYGMFAARYLQTAGLYGTLINDFREGTRPSSLSGSLGVELRPLFLVRFSSDWERGPAFADLLLDSLTLRLGIAIARSPGFDGSAPGFETGLGWGIPLTSRASGPWLDAFAGLRVSHRGLSGEHPERADRFALFTVCLSWAAIVDGHLVDAGDRIRR